MLTPEIKIRRAGGLWGGVSPETVKRYREELEELQRDLDQSSFLYSHNLFGSNELKESVEAAIDKEIKYCLFYDEYQEREANDPNLGQWVFTKQEDIEPKYDWLKPPGDEWTKTNGRIKATIQFDITGTMTKITLGYKNDSKHLDFCQQPRYTQKLPAVHLKNEDSINTKVQVLKNEADAFLQDHLYPLYSRYEEEMLNLLLHITSV